MRYFADSSILEVGYYNAWLSNGSRTTKDILQKLESCGKTTVTINDDVLESFSRWVKSTVQNEFDRGFVHGAIISMGMKKPWKNMMALFRDCVI